MSHKPLKPGEILADAPPGADATLGFIGHVETPWTTLADCPKSPDPEGPRCALVLDPAWEPALTGIERFEWIDVILWFHHARRDLLIIAPAHSEGPRGVFSLRSPVRPNPLAISRVRLVGRQGNRLTVRGLDALNGTPLIDIKPARG